MRVPIALATALLVALSACGGSGGDGAGEAAGGTEGRAERPTLEATAQAALDAFDGAALLAAKAILLALDSGYSALQVVDALIRGDLTATGDIEGVEPEGDAPDIIANVDAGAGSATAARGRHVTVLKLGARAQRVRLLSSVQATGETFTQQDLDRALDVFFNDVEAISEPRNEQQGLVGFIAIESILTLLQQGHSPEQVITALILGDIEVAPFFADVAIRGSEPDSDPIVDLFLSLAAGETTPGQGNEEPTETEPERPIVARFTGSFDRDGKLLQTFLNLSGVSGARGKVVANRIEIEVQGPLSLDSDELPSAKVTMELVFRTPVHIKKSKVACTAEVTILDKTVKLTTQGDAIKGSFSFETSRFRKRAGADCRSTALFGRLLGKAHLAATMTRTADRITGTLTVVFEGEKFPAPFSATRK